MNMKKIKHNEQRVILLYLLLAALICPSWSIAQNVIYPNSCSYGNITDYTQSWIGNDGGVPKKHIPHYIRSIYVRGDGTVATICEWDEGGANVGIYRNDSIISYPEYSGTGSYGRNSGKEVALDEQYVYQLMRFNGNSGGNDNLNANGLRAFPPKGSEEWSVITRYFVNTGKEAVFPLGYGVSNNMLLIAREASRQAAGLAITTDKLIVAVPGIASLSIPDSIKIYDKSTMSSVPIGGFKINDGGVGYLYADKKGFVWMKQGQKIVPFSLTTGAVRQQSVITLPDSVVNSSFCVDTRSGQERILIANGGKDLNVLIYTNIYTAPALTSTFGQKGGILAKTNQFVQGQVGYMRMEGPTGVGVDLNGNIYISNTFTQTAGATLHSYNESTKAFNWKKEGLEFTAVADFDNTRTNIAYSPGHVYKLDYTKKGQRLDFLVASTVDPFKYPNDMRCEPNPPTPIKCVTFKRKINGKDYLFVSTMYSTDLEGYRFTDSTGYVGIPFVRVTSPGLTFWNDKDGDGKPQTGEITTTIPAANSFSLFVDKAGNIWLADRNAPVSFRVWRVIGETNGILQYGPETVYKLPSYITDPQRVIYDSDKDELFISGYTTKYPFSNTLLWGECGTTILKYKDVSTKFASGIPSQNWQYDLEILLPWNTGNGYDTKSIAVAGDYVFCLLQTNGLINVYNRNTGDYAGQISPTDVVQKLSGWTDFCYAINARQNIDGSYEIFAEENAFAKIVHYYVNSMTGNVTIKGDLFPQNISVVNSMNQNVDIQNLRSGDSIKFVATVKNLEQGTITNSRRSDPTRCMVQFKVTDTSTGQVVYTAYSAPRQTDILRYEEFTMGIDSTLYQPWICVAGNYKLDIDVNYQYKGVECDLTNNTKSLTFGQIIASVNSPQESSLLLYPTPVSDELRIRIQLNENENNFTVRVISIEGKELLNKCFQNQSVCKLNVGNLPTGLYVIQITTSNQSYQRKFIIAR